MGSLSLLGWVLAIVVALLCFIVILLLLVCRRIEAFQESILVDLETVRKIGAHIANDLKDIKNHLEDSTGNTLP